MDSPVQFSVSLTVPCIKAIIACHFKVFFRDVPDKELNEVDDRERAPHIGIVFVAVIVEGDRPAVIVINAPQSDYGTSKVSADIFYDRICIAEVWFCIDVETVFIFAVDVCLRFFEGRSDVPFHFIKECGLESLAQVCIVEIFNGAPEAIIGTAAFGDEAVDMWVPFEGPSKGM